MKRAAELTNTRARASRAISPVNDAYCGVASVTADSVQLGTYFNTLYPTLNSDLSEYLPSGYGALNRGSALPCHPVSPGGGPGARHGAPGAAVQIQISRPSRRYILVGL